MPLPWMPRFLAMYAETKNLSWSATQAGISRQRVNQCRHQYPDFDEAILNAKQATVDLLRAKLTERAVFGWVEPVYQGGALVGYKRKHDNRLGVRILEADDPTFRRANEHPEEPAEDTAAQIRDAFAAMISSVPTEAPEGYVQPERAKQAVEIDPDLRPSTTPAICVECGELMVASAGGIKTCPKCPTVPRTGG